MNQIKLSQIQLEPYIYGLATLVSVWALGGGNNEILWNRSLALGIALSLLGLSALKVSTDWDSFRKEKLQWKISIAASIATSLPFIFLVYLLKKTTLLPYQVPTPTGIVGLLAFSFLVSFGSEIIYRKFLFPRWGLSTAAFVEALTLGFGSHYFFLFFAPFIMGHVWALLLPKYGLKTVILSRCLWTFFVFLSAYLIN